MDWLELLGWLFAVYALLTGFFIILDNRRPQSTLAWMLALYALPGLGLLIYVLFGRDRKAFARQSRLLKQDLEANAKPLVTPILAGQDEAISRLGGENDSYRKLLMLVRRSPESALTARNQVEILQNAETFYPRMLEDIQAARQSIYLQYYIWARDEFTDELKGILAGKAKAGVEVRLLYDPVGSQAHVGRAYVRDMQAEGIRMAPTSSLWRLHTISYRNHRKITVIDRRIGYLGGMNIGKEHLEGGRGFDLWRDTQLRIAGEGALILQTVFAVDWYNAVGENLFSPTRFPTGADDPAKGDVPAQILTSGPDSQWEAIRRLYFQMITTARHHVYLQSPYFIPDSSIAEAMKAAVLSGVDVWVMVTARPSGDPVPGWAANTFIMDVVEAGVKVFMYEKGYLHAKTISIDSEVCSIGSTNIDIRSFGLNYEINAVLYSKRLAGDLEEAFLRDLAFCTAFDPEDYQARNVALRFRDSAMRLISPLL